MQLRKTFIILSFILVILSVTTLAEEIPLDAYTTKIGPNQYNYISIEQNVLNDNNKWESCKTALSYKTDINTMYFAFGKEKITIPFEYSINKDSPKKAIDNISFEIEKRGCSFYYTQNLSSDIKVDNLSYIIPKNAKFNENKLIYNKIIIDFNQAKDEQEINIIYDENESKIIFKGKNIDKLDPSIIFNGSQGDLTDDTYVHSVSKTTNYGTSTEMSVRTSSLEGYIRFNLSYLNSNSSIYVTGAQLYLYPAYSQTLNVYKVYAYPIYNISGYTWNETTINYNSKPNSSQINNTVIGNMNSCSAQYCTVNVSSAILGNTDKNVTFKLNSSQSGSSTIYTKEYTTASKRPYLNITYSSYLSLEDPTPESGESINNSYIINVTTINPYNNTIFYNVNNEINITLCTDCTNVTQTINVSNYTDGSKTLNVYANDSTGAIMSNSITFNYFNGLTTIISTSQTMCGEYNYTYVVFTNNSIITICPYNASSHQGNNWTGTLRINAYNLQIDSGVNINGTGRGFRVGEGNGTGTLVSPVTTGGGEGGAYLLLNVTNNLIINGNIDINGNKSVGGNSCSAGSGAGYGGNGSTSLSYSTFGQTYGADNNVTDKGSGGGNGCNNNHGGGSGGGIRISARYFSGSGRLSVEGGGANSNGANSRNGCGAGGRIYLTYFSNTSSITYSVLEGGYNTSDSTNYCYSKVSGIHAQNGTFLEYLDTTLGLYYLNLTWQSGTNKSTTNVTWNFNVTDNSGLTNWLYSNNMSGSWANLSWIAITGTSNYSSFSFNLSNATRGKNVCFQSFVNNTLSNINNTDIKCLDVVNTAPITPTNLSPADEQTYNTAIVSFNFSSYDIDGDAVTYYLFINTSPNPATRYYNGTDKNYSVELANGTYYWTVIASDGYNNDSNTTIKHFHIDTSTTPPSINFTWESGTNKTLTNVTWNFTAAEDVSLSNWLYSNNMSGSWVNSSWTAITGTSNYSSFSFNLSNATRGKNVCFQVYINDSVPNMNSSDVKCLDVINTAPITPTNLSPDAGKIYGTNETVFNFSSTDADNDTITYYLFINKTATNPDKVNYTGTDKNSSAIFSDGVYYWTVLASDGYGNSSNTTIRNFTIDTTKPTITLNKPSNGNTTNNNYVLFNWTATDLFSSYMSCNLTINGLVNQSNLVATNNTPYTITVYNSFTNGIYYWNVTCNDSAGNTNTSATYNFTINILSYSIMLNFTSNDLYEDAYITLNFPTLSNGDSRYLMVSSKPIEISWSYLKFNTTYLNDKFIQSAVLYLNGASGSDPVDGTISVYSIYAFPAYNITNATGSYEWDEGIWPGAVNSDDLMWSNMANTSSQMNLSYINTTRYAGDDTHTLFNVTKGLLYSLNTRETNVSFMLNSTSTTSTFFYYSKDEANDTRRPYLNITYSVNTPPTEPVLQYQSGTNKSLTNVTLNFTVTDTEELGPWLYANNMSGSWINSSWYSTLSGTSDTDSFSFNLSNATRGKNVCFQVFVNDSGTILPSQNSSNVTCLDVINTAPITPTNLSPASEYYSSNNTISFNFSSYDIDGDTITYYLFINESTNPSTVHYSSSTYRNFTTSLPNDSMYYWSVIASDGYNNDSNSTIRNLTIDTLGPYSITLNAPAAGNATSNDDITFNWTTTDLLSFYMSCNLIINGLVNQSNLVATNNTPYTITIYNNFTDGVYYWNVTCNDTAGNTNSSSTRNFTVDSTKPVSITLNAPAKGNATNNNDVAFNWTVIDATSSQLTCNLTIDGLVYSTSVVNNNTSYNVTIIDLAEGTYYWNVTCNDSGLNVNTSETYHFSIDSTPPYSITLNNPINDDTLSSNDINFGWTISDLYSTYMSCNLTINNVINQSNLVATNATAYTFTVNDFVDGVYYWNITCNDSGLNLNTSDTYNFTITTGGAAPTGGGGGLFQTQAINETSVFKGDEIINNFLLDNLWYVLIVALIIYILTRKKDW